MSWDKPPEDEKSKAEAAEAHAEAEERRVERERAMDAMQDMLRQRREAHEEFKRNESKLVPGVSKSEVQMVLFLLFSALMAGVLGAYMTFGIEGALFAWAAWAMSVWIFGGRK